MLTIVAVAFNNEPKLLKETELLTLLNGFKTHSISMEDTINQDTKIITGREKLRISRDFIKKNITELNLPFSKPEVNDHSVFLNSVTE